MHANESPSGAYGELTAAVVSELQRAEQHYRPIASLHEGMSVIREEYEEAWDLAKTKSVPSYRLRAELIQTAAMCLRTIKDLDIANHSRQFVTGAVRR